MFFVRRGLGISLRGSGRESFVKLTRYFFDLKKKKENGGGGSVYSYYNGQLVVICFILNFEQIKCMMCPSVTVSYNTFFKMLWFEKAKTFWVVINKPSTLLYIGPQQGLYSGTFIS